MSADRTAPEVRTRVARTAAVRGWSAVAALWLLVWLHGAVTHGLTQENERRLWLGMTWMDSAKFLVLPFAGLAVALVLSGRVARPLRGWGRGVWIAAVVVVAVQTVGVALQFWPFPWGSYPMSFATAPAATSIGGALQAVGSLAGGLLMMATGVAFVRAGVFRGWAVLVLAVGMLATFYLSPVSWLPAVAWLLVAGAVWRGGQRLVPGPAPH